MIERLYVDNYRCLQDFTWKPGAEALVLGYNGSGKTTVLDAIGLIRNWASGWVPIATDLDARELTRWGESKVVRFEMDLRLEGVTFRYKVEFDCTERPSVRSESLKADKRTIFVRTQESVAFYDGDKDPKSHVPVPQQQSAVASLSATQKSSLLTDFLAGLEHLIVIRPIPSLMEVEAKFPEHRAEPKFENFVAWYWHHVGIGAFGRELPRILTDVWEEFDYLNLDAVGKSARGLSVVFRKPHLGSGELVLEFQELSEGERMLIALYCLVAYQRSTPATTIIVDEPDNFVAISELQPWLLTLLDERKEGGQIIIVSHNAEIMQNMGVESVSYFEREDHLSPSRIVPIKDDESGLALSERLRRGWLQPPETAKEKGRAKAG